MIATLAQLWASIKGVPNIVGILIGAVATLAAATLALFGVVIASIVSLRNTGKTLKQSKEALEIQRASSTRPAATFIADKRQKWIDDLRDDASLFVALTQEIADSWKRATSKFNIEWENERPYSQDQLDYYTNLAIAHAASIAERDSLQAHLLTRIMLRLNIEEHAHRELTDLFYRVRAGVRLLSQNAANHEYSNQDIYDSIDSHLQLAQVYGKAILAEEWRKLKREVADPERLIKEILATSPPNDATVDAFVQKVAPSVPTVIDIPAPKRKSSPPKSQG